MSGRRGAGEGDGYLAGQKLEHGCVAGGALQINAFKTDFELPQPHTLPGAPPGWTVRLDSACGTAKVFVCRAPPATNPPRGWGSSKGAPHAAFSRKRGPPSRGRAFPTAMAALRVLGRTRALYGADRSPLRAGCQGPNLGWPASPAPKTGAGGSTPVQRRTTSPR